MRALTALGAIVLTLGACAGLPAGTPSQTVSNLAGWSYWSAGDFAGLTPAPGGLAAFTFPVGDPGLDHIDYVTRAHGGPLTGKTLTATYEITGAAPIAPNTKGFGACGGAVLHLFFAAPNYGVDGTAAENTQRWWSIATGPLTPGKHTISVPLDPADWIDVNGQTGTQQSAGFAAALANVGSTGVTFGAQGCAAGHGAAASAPGDEFTLYSLTAG